MTFVQLYQIASILILAALLFFPVSKMIWVMRVRRLQHQLERELDPQELSAQLRRARIVSAFIVLIFAYLFNISVLGELHG